MDFEYSEEQKAIKATVSEFAKKEIAPGAMERDVNEKVPWEIIKRLGELGMTGDIPTEYGGSGLDFWSWCLVLEEIAKYDLALSGALTTTSGAARRVVQLGTEELKRKWIPPIARGEALACAAITEPDAGSWVKGLKTRAALDSGEWVINGTKTYITNGSVCSYCLVLSRTGADGFSLILVPRGTLGFVARKLHKVGARSCDCAELLFDNCRVPKENLVGEADKALEVMYASLAYTRTLMASTSLGLSQACFNDALSYARQRMVRGRPISKLQDIQTMLVEMATSIELGHLIRDKSAWLISQGCFDAKIASMAKLFCSEAANRNAYLAVQIFGGMGIMSDVAVSRYMREARYLTIADGTSQIQKYIIARELGC